MKKGKLGISLLLLIVLVGSSVGCSSKNKEAKADTSPDNQRGFIEEGKMLVGMCPEYPPFESVNSDGDIEGFDVDLAKAIGKEMGVETEYINTPWEGLIAGLDNDTFDVIMSGMSPEEAKESGDKVAVTESYYALKEIIVTKDKNIKSKEDLEGKNVGCHAGSASEFALESLNGQGVTIKESVPYNRHSEAFTDLLNGNIDAMVVELPWAEQKVKDNKEAMIVDDLVQVIEIAGVFSKKNEDKVKTFNTALDTLKENGTYDKIISKWFIEE